MGFRATVVVSAIVAALLAAAPANGQSFYQLTNPRLYRVDPPTSNPWYHDYGFGSLAWRPVEGNSNGVVLMSWEVNAQGLAESGHRGDLIEVAINFGSSPNAAGTNDATLISQVLDWSWCISTDYDSDDRVLVTVRTDYTSPYDVRLPAGALAGAYGVGRFTRENGAITGFRLTNPFKASKPLADNRNNGAFAGLREVGGVQYDTAAFLSGYGIFLADIATGELIGGDAEGTPAGYDATYAKPYIWFTGPSRVTDVPTKLEDGTRMAGIDVVGDIAFVLMYLNMETSNQYLALMQVDLAAKRVLSLANVSQMLNPNRAGRCSNYTYGFAVSAASSSAVRVLIADCTDPSSTTLAAIDGVSVPEGTAAVDPAAVYVEPSDGGQDPNQPSGANGSTDTNGTTDTNGSTSQQDAVIWVCPGIGIALPTVAVCAALFLSHAARRPIPRRRAGGGHA